MFILKKIISAFLLPIPLGLFLLLISFIYLLSNSYTKAKVFLFISLCWFLLLSNQVVSNAIISPLENSHKALLNPPLVEYILVLGSGHKTNETLSITSQLRSIPLTRLSEGLKLHKQIPNARLIVSGYKGFDKNYHSVMSEKLLLALGTKEENIIRMDKPVNTQEEAQELKKILGDKSFILVTSAAHMKRAMILFRHEGLNPIAAPTNHLAYETKDFHMQFSSVNLVKVESAIHEYLGLLWFYSKEFIFKTLN